MKQKQQIHLFIDLDLYKKIKKDAKEKELPVVTVIRKILKKHYQK